MGERRASYKLGIDEFLRAERQFVRIPLAWASDRLLPGFWNYRGGPRGSGTITAVLVSTLLHTWKFKADRASGERSDWTRHAFLPVRRLSALSGCDQESILEALEILQADEWLRRTKAHRVGRRPVLKLQANIRKLHLDAAQAGHLPARALVGGHLATLSSSARHLLIALCCTDPVRHEVGFRRHLADQERFASDVLEHRRRRARTLSEYHEVTGMHEDTFARAISVLRQSRAVFTAFGRRERPLVLCVAGRRRATFCYYPDNQALATSAHDLWSDERGQMSRPDEPHDLTAANTEP